MRSDGQMVSVRFERPRDDTEGPLLGPFAWFQVTYDDLRTAPDGQDLAHYDEACGEWFLEAMHPAVAALRVGAPCDADLLGPWSDFVIAPTLAMTEDEQSGHPK